MCFPFQANLSIVFSGALKPLPIMMQEFREPGRATWNHSVSKNSQHCSSCWTQCVFLFKLTCQLYFQVHWSRSQSWCKNFESLRQISAASASEAPAIAADNYIWNPDPLPECNIPCIYMYMHVWDNACLDILCIYMYIHAMRFCISGWFSNVCTFTHTAHMQTTSCSRQIWKNCMHILDLC